MSHPDQWFGGETFSQHGEDLVTLAVFHALGIERGRYLDIGCHHPWNISNTALLYKRGWRGTCVDANPEMERFWKERPEDTFLNAAVGEDFGEKEFLVFDPTSGRNTLSESEAQRCQSEWPGSKVRARRMVDVVPLNWLIKRTVIPHFVSVDAEGLDYEILRSYEPGTGPVPALFCVETRRSQAAAMVSMMGLKGYFPLIRMGENLLFLRREHRDQVMGVA